MNQTPSTLPEMILTLSSKNIFIHEATGWEVPDNNLTFNLQLCRSSRGLLIDGLGRGHMCVPKRAVPCGDEHSGVGRSVTGYGVFLTLLLPHTPVNETQWPDNWPGGIWESGFALWPSGVNYSQGWVSHSCRRPQQNAVNRPGTMGKAAVTRGTSEDHGEWRCHSE